MFFRVLRVCYLRKMCRSLGLMTSSSLQKEVAEYRSHQCSRRDRHSRVSITAHWCDRYAHQHAVKFYVWMSNASIPGTLPSLTPSPHLFYLLPFCLHGCRIEMSQPFPNDGVSGGHEIVQTSPNLSRACGIGCPSKMAVIRSSAAMVYLGFLLPHFILHFLFGIKYTMYDKVVCS